LSLMASYCAWSIFRDYVVGTFTNTC
jgi:hypothetical protein